MTTQAMAVKEAILFMCIISSILFYFRISCTLETTSLVIFLNPRKSKGGGNITEISLTLL